MHIRYQLSTTSPSIPQMPGVHKFDCVAKREAAAAELIDVYISHLLIWRQNQTFFIIFHYSIAAQDE